MTANAIQSSGRKVVEELDPVQLANGWKLVQVTAANATRVGASDVIAFHEASFGRFITLRPAVKNERVTLASERANGAAGGVKVTKVGETVAVVRILGPLANRAIADLCGYVDGYDAIGARFAAACESDADSILLVIDSPGGDVAGLEQVGIRMRGAAERAGKKVVVYVDEMAASAAYSIACVVGDEILLPNTGMVGSIGCIGGFVDESKALEQAGVKVTLVRYPEGKAESHPADVIEDLALQRTRARVDRFGKQFVALVAAKRGLSASVVEGFNADMFVGSDAVKQGLADKVATFEEALSRAAKLGREARKQKEAKMSDSSNQGTILQAEAIETENDRTVKALCAKLGVTSTAEMIGRVDAGIRATETVAKLAAELEKAQAEVKTLKAAEAKMEATLVIQKAKDEMRILGPEHEKDVMALFEQHGLDALKASIKAMPPLPAAAKVCEPAPPSNETSAGDKPPSVAANPRPKAQWTNAEKVAFCKQHGAKAYRALP